jgi:hypothetical protein
MQTSFDESAGEMTCPKCGFAQKQAQECARCGIIIAKFLKAQQQKACSETPKTEAIPEENLHPQPVRQVAAYFRARLKDDRIYFEPHIPEKILNNALQKAKDPEIAPGDVLVVLDDSMLGSGKEGALITSESIYGYGMQASGFHRLDDIRSVTIRDPKGFGIGATGVVLEMVRKSVTSELHIDGSLFMTVLNPKKQAMVLFAQMLEKMSYAAKYPDQELGLGVANRKPQAAIAGSVPAIVKSYIKKISSPQFFFQSNGIPFNKIENAISSYAPNLKSNDILLLVDTTLSKNAKNGVIVTPDALYARDLYGRAQQFPFHEMESASLVPGVLNDSIRINDAPVITVAMSERVSSQFLVEMLKEIRELFRPIEISAADKLKELKDLYESKVLTEAEYLQKRDKYLNIL